MSLVILGRKMYDPSAEAYFRTIPNPYGLNGKGLINGLITSLKASGDWYLLDRLWIFANSTSGNAVVDLKSLQSCTLVNTPTFTELQGYGFNGTTQYINTNFIPSINGVQAALQSSTYLVYSRTATTSATAYNYGVSDGTNALDVQLKHTDGSSYGRIYSGGYAGAAVTNSQGLFALQRSSNTVTIYRNGTTINSISQAAGALPTLAVFAGARNVSGAASGYATNQLAAFAIGGAVNLTTFQTALETYMDSVGAGVI